MYQNACKKYGGKLSKLYTNIETIPENGDYIPTLLLDQYEKEDDKLIVLQPYEHFKNFMIP